MKYKTKDEIKHRINLLYLDVVNGMSEEYLLTIIQELDLELQNLIEAKHNEKSNIININNVNPDDRMRDSKHTPGTRNGSK